MAQPQSSERVLSRQMCALFQKGSCETCILTIMVVAQMTSLRIRCVERGTASNNAIDDSPTLSAPARAVPDRRPPRMEPPRIDLSTPTESAFQNQLGSLGAPTPELGAPHQESNHNVDTDRITGKPKGSMPFDPGLEDGEVIQDWIEPPVVELPYRVNGGMPLLTPMQELDEEQQEIKGTTSDIREGVEQQGVGSTAISPDTEYHVSLDSMSTVGPRREPPKPEITDIENTLDEGEQLVRIPLAEVDGETPEPEPDFVMREMGYGVFRDTDQVPEGSDLEDLEDVLDGLLGNFQPEGEFPPSFELDWVVSEDSNPLPVPDTEGVTIVARNEAEEEAQIKTPHLRSGSSGKTPMWLVPVMVVGSFVILFCIICLCLVCDSEHTQSKQARETSSLTTSATEIDDIPEAPEVLPPLPPSPPLPPPYAGLPDANAILRTELLYRAARYGFTGALPEALPQALPPRARPVSL